MVAVLERLKNAVSHTGSLRVSLARGFASTPHSASAEERIGEYYADYSAIPTDKLSQPMDDVDELFARSSLVSESRGL